MWPSQPASINPAVEWMSNPSRPSELFLHQLGEILEVLLPADHPAV
jgi:hypothetical protein